MITIIKPVFPFRALDTRTTLGQAFLQYSSRGELVPDDLTVKLWQARIADMVRFASMGARALTRSSDLSRRIPSTAAASL